MHWTGFSIESVFLIKIIIKPGFRALDRPLIKCLGSERFRDPSKNIQSQSWKTKRTLKNKSNRATPDYSNELSDIKDTQNNPKVWSHSCNLQYVACTLWLKTCMCLQTHISSLCFLNAVSAYSSLKNSEIDFTFMVMIDSLVTIPTMTRFWQQRNCEHRKYLKITGSNVSYISVARYLMPSFAHMSKLAPENMVSLWHRIFQTSRCATC